MPDEIVPAVTPTPEPATEQQTQPQEPPKPVMVEEEKYKAAVREMNEKQRLASIREKELELTKKELEFERSRATSISAPNSAQPTDDQKRALEDKYGVPYGQIQLTHDILALKHKEVDDLKSQIGELSNTIYEDRYESTKDRLKADDPIFEKFMPEVEARLNMLPMRQRTNREELAKIKQEVIGSHLTEIMQMAEERGRSSVTARPPAPPEVNSPGGGSANPTSPRVTHLTAEQRAFIEKSGGNVQAVEEFVKGKKNSQSRWGNYAE